METTLNSIDILMVDDRDDGLLALEALLSENKNYRLVKARSGLEAYSLLAGYDFAVILMDVQMPELDGFQTAELIRKNPAYSKIPIIFVTAINKDDRYIYKGYQAGAVDYIFKPFDPFILTSKVSVFAELHQQKRMLFQQANELREKRDLEFETKIQKAEIEGLRRYQNLADSIPHIVWQASSDGSVEYCNQIWRTFTGLSLEESQEMGWQRAIHEGDLKLLLGLWMHSIQSREDFEMECRVRRHDGEMRWHLVRAVAERGPQGEVLAWLGTGTDIHDRKISEKRLIQAQKAAEAASQAKTQFLANMSHEIRTPLGAIIGFTELTLEPSISEEERISNLSIVRRNGHQLLKIIDEVLDVSKVEAGRLETERVETDLVEMLCGIQSLLQINAANKGIKLNFRIEDQIPSHVLTDGTRLRQILMNVIGNAIKFTNYGEVTLTANQKSVDELESVLVFRVKDTGIGMSPETIERLFTPFLQGDSSTTRLYGGTGLGLALARQLARALGGELTLEYSEVGFGTTFRIEIPCESMPHAVGIKSLGGDDSSPLAEEPEIPASEALSGAKVLLVEDAEDNQILISHFLKKSGIQLDFACNGKEGIEKALANDYSLVLMDIQMPVIDGYEATSRLRKAGYSKPILALTAHALKEEKEMALRTGCNGHITKPIDRKDLLENIKKHVFQDSSC